MAWVTLSNRISSRSHVTRLINSSNANTLTKQFNSKLIYFVAEESFNPVLRNGNSHSLTVNLEVFNELRITFKSLNNRRKHDLWICAFQITLTKALCFF